MKYKPVDGKAILTGYGTAPVMIISNAGTLCGFSTQTGTGSTSVKPRMVAGFDHLELSMIDYTTPFMMGNVTATGLTGPLKGKSHTISPNPVKDILNITSTNHSFTYEINDMKGIRIQDGFSAQNSVGIGVSDLKPGLYLLKTFDPKTNNPSISKFIKD